MATVQASTRADIVRVLPTYHDAAELIELHPSGITRAVAKLGIVPELWGGGEKHLRVVDVLRIAAQARRASVEEVAGALLERASGDPVQHEAVRVEIDRYFAEVYQPAKPASGDAFLAELREALPERYARQAERIYRSGRGTSVAQTPLDLAGLRARKQGILACAAEYGASNVRVFGSTVRGEAGESSDVDFLVEMQPGRNLLDLVGLCQDLEDLLGTHVDVLSDGGVSSHLRERIYAEAVPL